MQNTITQVREGDDTSLVLEAPSATPGGTLVFSDREEISVSLYEQELIRRIDEGTREIIFNFRDLAFMNSSYMAMLTTLGSYLQKKGGRVKFVNLDERRVKLIEMVGVLDLFKLYKTVDEAISDTAG
ncbi:STAS domain-containing protein [Candidatus Uabimicrobium amorphum]|uniref:Anti-sigma factor antagonist n=1 Tax=Uabimicrobium amorphum TaxID=2596890 RepID=A0A5S9IK71_UABAM|nr:STAS domain-containing protein [Candidatus Uabimicrobium amorphum]BBM83050.1 anti-sigma factor antagonist [Candidatus Uabimicrobium amorphum]